MSFDEISLGIFGSSPYFSSIDTTFHVNGHDRICGAFVIDKACVGSRSSDTAGSEVHNLSRRDGKTLGRKTRVRTVRTETGYTTNV